MQHSEEPVPKRHKKNHDSDAKESSHTNEVPIADSSPSDRHRSTGDAQPQSHEGSAAVASTPNDTAQPPQEGSAEQKAASPEVARGVYSQREAFLAKREAEGELTFRYVENDGARDNSMWLVSLKNTISKQLPNMPKEYIARLVMDRRHRSCAIVAKSGTVLGGITYRPFHAQGFGEIAFCAVTAMEQVKGFGTRLMNHTKMYARERDHLTHFLTYADNNAVGYFAKQGFTKEITLDRDRWVGWIKDYDGGTLMECVINSKLPYTDFPGLVEKQREALDRHIRTLSKSHVVHPSIGSFGSGRIDVGSIPGVKEAGWEPEEETLPPYRLSIDRVMLPPTPENLQTLMQDAWQALNAHEDSWPFREPVDPEDVPDYLDVIKDPVDLSLIKKRLDSKTYYITLNIFAADVNRMCANARVYNNAETIYFKLANRIEDFLEEYLHSHLVYSGK
ncbi:g13075 [Coccomyxa viridis]|uniref:histone acetyltransferase n=1 Tax=Coccomyxa viridis TaxID=1274662 RepID=A0ABP1GHG5_9CHLO